MPCLLLSGALTTVTRMAWTRLARQFQAPALLTAGLALAFHRVYIQKSSQNICNIGLNRPCSQHTLLRLLYPLSHAPLVLETTFLLLDNEDKPQQTLTVVSGTLAFTYTDSSRGTCGLSWCKTPWQQDRSDCSTPKIRQGEVLLASAPCETCLASRACDQSHDHSLSGRKQVHGFFPESCRGTDLQATTGSRSFPPKPRPHWRLVSTPFQAALLGDLPSLSEHDSWD